MHFCPCGRTGIGYFSPAPFRWALSPPNHGGPPSPLRTCARGPEPAGGGRGGITRHAAWIGLDGGPGRRRWAGARGHDCRRPGLVLLGRTDFTSVSAVWACLSVSLMSCPEEGGFAPVQSHAVVFCSTNGYIIKTTEAAAGQASRDKQCGDSTSEHPDFWPEYGLENFIHRIFFRLLHFHP